MRKKLGLVLIFGAAVPLAAASIAWACGVLTTVSLSDKVAAPGATVTATGKNYSTAAGVSAITLRLKSRTGRVLATTAAQSGGKLNTTFTVPSDLSPGWYVILATQFNANGTPKSGTPGRTTLRIQGGAGAGAVPPLASKPGDGGGLPLLPLLLAAGLSVTMLAAGWTLVARRGRTASAPLSV